MSTIVLVLTGSSVTVSQGRAAVTATVTNKGTARESVVLGVFPPAGAGAPGSAVGWTSVERPQRDLAPDATEQFTVTFVPPEGTAAGTYAARFIAYSAIGAPEESADQARQLDVVIPAGAVAPAPVRRTPWWIYAVAAALVVVVGVVAFLVLRPSAPCEGPGCASPSASPTPTPASIDGISWRLTSIRQADAITVPLTSTVTLRVQDGRVSGSDGCNAYSGVWSQDGADVKVGPLMSTRKLCFPQQVNQQAALFTGILSAVSSLRSDGDTLELTTGDDRALRFQRA